MRALNYLEFESRLDRSGIGTATDHQRRALAGTDVEVLTSPWAGGGPAASVARRAFGDPVFAEFDLAHCNLIGPGSVAVARYSRRNDIPLVLHAHVTREDFAESFRGSTAVAPALGRYLRWFYSQADLVLCPSEYTGGVLESYPVSAPIRPVTNGVDLEALEGHQAFREPYRDRYDLEGLVVFAVGNVFERKGLSTFCRLAAETDHEFAWFGPYDAGPQAARAVRRWVGDPPSNVTFTGWIEDKRGAFAAGDVFCFPAKVENQGLVVLGRWPAARPSSSGTSPSSASTTRTATTACSVGRGPSSARRSPGWPKTATSGPASATTPARRLGPTASTASPRNSARPTRRPASGPTRLPQPIRPPWSNPAAC